MALFASPCLPASPKLAYVLLVHPACLQACGISEPTSPLAAARRPTRLGCVADCSGLPCSPLRVGTKRRPDILPDLASINHPEIKAMAKGKTKRPGYWKGRKDCPILGYWHGKRGSLHPTSKPVMTPAGPFGSLTLAAETLGVPLRTAWDRTVRGFNGYPTGWTWL